MKQEAFMYNEILEEINSLSRKLNTHMENLSDRQPWENRDILEHLQTELNNMASRPKLR